MPSGAKKRKAAKKKKEKEANSSPIQGEDYTKVHEEKESDSGETNSPLSQDNRNNTHFIEGENKREEDKSTITKKESIGVNGNGSIPNKVAIEEKSSIQIDREIKLKDVTIEHIEIDDMYSNSSSDGESKFVAKKIEVINLEKPVKYDPNLKADLEKVIRVNEAVLQNLAVIPRNEESCRVVPIVDISNLVSEIKPQVEPVVWSKEKVHLDEDLGTEINGKSEILEALSSVIDIGSQPKVDIISTKATEDSKIATVEESEAFDKVNGVEHKIESEIESMDRQTPVTVPPQPVKASSSMGCCGLFELFMGSNR